MSTEINKFEFEIRVALEMMKGELEEEVLIIDNASSMEQVAESYERCAAIARKYASIIEEVDGDISG